MQSVLGLRAVTKVARQGDQAWRSSTGPGASQDGGSPSMIFQLLGSRGITEPRRQLLRSVLCLTTTGKGNPGQSQRARLQECGLTVFLHFYLCGHVPQHVCGAQRTTRRSWFSRSIMQISVIKPRPPGLCSQYFYLLSYLYGSQLTVFKLSCDPKMSSTYLQSYDPQMWTKT